MYETLEHPGVIVYISGNSLRIVGNDGVTESLPLKEAPNVQPKPFIRSNAIRIVPSVNFSRTHGIE